MFGCRLDRGIRSAPPVKAVAIMLSPSETFLAYAISSGAAPMSSQSARVPSMRSKISPCPRRSPALSGARRHAARMVATEGSVRPSGRSALHRGKRSRAGQRVHPESVRSRRSPIRRRRALNGTIFSFGHVSSFFFISRGWPSDVRSCAGSGRKIGSAVARCRAAGPRVAFAAMAAGAPMVPPSPIPL
jgi:hypothetical protein